MEQETKITDEQLWMLCLEEEKKKKILNDARDKGVDWEWERFIFDRNKNLK